MNEEIDLAKHELKSLRDELHALKRCQITFLTSAFTITGIILGFVQWSDSGTEPLVYLLPLVVIIPAWWFFLDKAKTITRIVGYYRILESYVLKRITIKNFIGWENSLDLFREKAPAIIKEKKVKLNESPKPYSRLLRFMAIMSPGSPHAYWALSYYTFGALSLLCLALSIYKHPVGDLGRFKLFLFLLSLLIIVFSFCRHLFLIWKLTIGYNSYKANQLIWDHILSGNQPGRNLS